MSMIASVKDGKVVETETQNSLKSKATGNKSGMDKESFLQLLVAQMKYQDPLQPTTNTEYVSQFAQFSQVEQMQNMAATSELSRASSLVGKQVYVKTVNPAGESKYIQGKVDYVVFENGKPFLSINESLYDLEDLDTVADEAYMEAFEITYNFVTDLKKLPALNALGAGDVKAIQSLQETYEKMNEYQQSFIPKEDLDLYKAYVEKMKELTGGGDSDETAEQ